MKIVIDKKDFMEYIRVMVDKDFDNFMFSNPYATEEDYISLYYPFDTICNLDDVYEEEYCKRIINGEIEEIKERKN